MAFGRYAVASETTKDGEDEGGTNVAVADPARVVGSAARERDIRRRRPRAAGGGESDVDWGFRVRTDGEALRPPPRRRAGSSECTARAW